MRHGCSHFFHKAMGIYMGGLTLLYMWISAFLSQPELCMNLGCKTDCKNAVINSKLSDLSRSDFQSSNLIGRK